MLRVAVSAAGWLVLLSAAGCTWGGESRLGSVAPGGYWPMSGAPRGQWEPKLAEGETTLSPEVSLGQPVEAADENFGGFSSD